MKKYAQINRENGEILQFINIQEVFAKENMQGPDNTFYMNMPEDTDEALYMGLRYWKQSEETWAHREACPGEYYYWRDERWVYDNTKMWNDIRGRRNGLLKDSDWTQLEDAPISNETKLAWRAYREALRQLPDTQSNATSIDDIGWPGPPS